MLRRFWPVLFLLLPQASAAQQLLSQASHTFDATYYHLTLDVRFDSQNLYGHTRIEGTVASGTLDTLVLDFASRMAVDSVMSGGEKLDFRHAGDALRVGLASVAGSGERVAIEVAYHGVPARDGFGNFVFGTRGNGDPYAWSLSEPYGAREWWPCRDHPSDKADSVRVTVTVPDSMQVGSNGLLVEVVDHGDGTRTFDWFSRYPIATYLVSVAAGVYEVHNQTYVRPDTLGLPPLSLPLVHYAYRGSNVYEGTSVDYGWKHVVDVLPIEEWWFGGYPFSAEKYGHSHFTFGGGMEHQTMSSMGGSYVGLIAHELAHQWFGDLITTETWPHLWLNEGFATYAELLIWQARGDVSPGTFDAVFDIYYRRALSASGTLVVQDTTDVRSLFASERVYSKGGMVLHMLRGITGDSLFREVLRAYTASELVRFGTATTADFRSVAENVTGLDFKAFFRQWVTEGTGFPIYDVRWAGEEVTDGYRIDVSLEQTQEPPTSNVAVFVMPVTMQVRTAGGSEEFTVLSSERLQSFTFHVSEFPEEILFDPERMILQQSSVGQVGSGTEGAPRELHSLRVYPNPVVGMFRAEWDFGAPGRVQVALYDVLGRRVRLLVDEVTERLSGAWDLTDLASGVYLLEVVTPKGTVVREVAVMN